MTITGFQPYQTPLLLMFLPTLSLIVTLVLIFFLIRFFIQFDRALTKIGTLEHDLKEIKTYLQQRQ
ncbi:hypothetical protein F3D3_0644 [Fusibacter sp. 3D3]|nr:hypothetical protein F3D3_0644 [Fusibacter sp. 3D3]